MITGATLAKALGGRSASGEADLRVTLQDPYGRKVRSNILTVAVDELEREDYW